MKNTNKQLSTNQLVILLKGLTPKVAFTKLQQEHIWRRVRTQLNASATPNKSQGISPLGATVVAILAVILVLWWAPLLSFITRT